MTAKEYIISVLSEMGANCLTVKTICKKLGIYGREQKQELEKLLIQMEKENLIILLGDKYYLYENAGLVSGRIKRHERGYAFLLRDDKKDDLFIPPSMLYGAYNGDRVLVKIVASDGEKSDEAEVVKILERGVNELIGVYFAERGYGFVCPDDKAFGSDIYVQNKKGVTVVTGQKVAVKILSYPAKGNPTGEIVQVLGSANSVRAQEASILFEHGAPGDFDEALLNEAKAITDKISEDEWLNRENFTDLLTVTIDGDDAKDFDDAISVQKTQKGYTLYVHIADVSHYVTSGSLIDKEAYSRGTSIYLPSRVIPMLPEKLCNDVCSLVPNQNRLTLTVRLDYDKNGNVIDKCFYKSIINSNYRLTYNKVQAIFDGDEALKEQYSNCVDMLFFARELKDKILNLRNERGYVNLDVQESKVYFDKQGNLLVEGREGLESERLIEQFMIAANVAVAEFIHYSEMPGIYRVHENPSAEKLQSFCNFLNAAGIKTVRKPQYPREFQQILLSVENTPISGVISDVMLRSMQKAEYLSENKGHFGLNEKCYCHFTSPIRRYPDLVMHRILKSMLQGQTGEAFEYYSIRADEIAQNCSLTERRADLIERDTDDLYICKFMNQFIGDFFEGVISGVTSFGIFVRLAGNLVEGLIPLEYLPNGRYEFLAESFTLKGSKISFKLGETVLVKLISANIQSRKIDFELIHKI